MRLFCRIVLIILVFHAVPWIAYGDDAEIRDLRSRVEYLEKKVEIMNQTLTRMLAILDSSPPASMGQQKSASDRLKWEDKQNWRRLRSGMSKAEVVSLLGEPDRIDKYSFFEVWQYGDLGGGTIHFSSRETVESWSEP